MKFSVQSKLLLSHLQAVSKVVASKSPLTILENFLFTLEGSELIITGSDQETTLTSHVDVTEVEGSGKFAANVKKLLDILKELPDIGLTIEVNNENLEIIINYQHGHFNFIGVNGNEFPMKAVSDEVPTEFTLPVNTVIDGIQRTVFACSTETIRPVMTGIYWDIKPESIVFVASDTHKLVRYEVKSVKPGLEYSFILPAKPANVLSQILERSEENVKISVDSKSITFETSKFSLSCLLIVGRYPNYNNVIPHDNPYEINIDRATMAAAVKRVSVFANSGGLVRFDLKTNNIKLSAQDVDFSTSAEEDMTCDYTGAEMVIGFNGANVVDVVNSITNEGITLKLMDPTRAGIFVPTQNKDNEELLILLMPMVV